MSKFTKIELPKFSKFTSNKSDVSPYELFHYWISSNFGKLPKNKTINVSASWLHPKDATALDDKVKRWIHKYYKGHTDLWKKRAFEMHRLDISPANWQDNSIPSDIEKGFVYVQKSKLYESKQ